MELVLFSLMVVLCVCFEVIFLVLIRILRMVVFGSEIFFRRVVFI